MGTEGAEGMERIRELVDWVGCVASTRRAVRIAYLVFRMGSAEKGSASWYLSAVELGCLGRTLWDDYSDEAGFVNRISYCVYRISSLREAEDGEAWGEQRIAWGGS